MKLVSFDDGKIGLFVVLPNGPHAVDIAASVGVFAPHEPLANGILNGSFKDGGNWSTIVNHWAYIKPPLRRLAHIAEICPEHPSLVLRPLTGQPPKQGTLESIVAIEITDTSDLPHDDPTGRRAMERQFTPSSEENTAVAPETYPGVAEIIDFQHRKDHDARK